MTDHDPRYKAVEARVQEWVNRNNFPSAVWFLTKELQFDPPVREDLLRNWYEQAYANAIDAKYRRNGHAVPEQAITPEDATNEMEAMRRVVREQRPNPARADDWLVRNMIRPGSLCVLASPEGVGKSFAHKELSIRGALGPEKGGALFNYVSLAIQRRFRTVLIEVENGEDEESDREAMILDTLGVTYDDIGDEYIRYSFAGTDLVTKVGRAKVRAAVALDRPDLLVIDTATSQSTVEWGEVLKDVLNWVRSLAVEFKVAVLLVVHMIKPVRDPKSGSRAGIGQRGLSDVMGQWTRPADAVFVMDAASGDDRAIFRTYKRLPVKTKIVITQKQGIWDVVGTAKEPARIIVAGKIAKDILQGIADGIEPLNEKTLKCSRTGFYDALKSLRESGLVGDGQPYRLTAEGEAALDQSADESADSPLDYEEDLGLI
jgi:hypothetical protein